MSEPTTKERAAFAKAGYAMPDGSYYIRDGAQGVADLDNAINAVGRAEPQSSHNAVRKHIITRAKALGKTDMIPDNWNPDGSLKHADPVEAFLAHYGVEGMRWGHHLRRADFIERAGQQGHQNGPPQPPPDHQREAADALAKLHELAARTAAEAQTAQAAAKASPTPANKAVAAASTAHAIATKAKAASAASAHATHKAKQLPKSHSGNSAHAKQMKNAHAKAQAAHAAHKAKVAKMKGHKPAPVHLSAKQKAELAKLTPAQRGALAKLTPDQRKVLANMSEKDKKELSKLSQAQKDALAKATAASAAKRHAAAEAKKAAQHSDLDPVDEFLSHHGVKGMHWGIRRARTPAEKIAKLDKAISTQQRTLDYHEGHVNRLKADLKDAHENGTQSAEFKRRYGNHLEAAHQLIHHETKAESLARVKRDAAEELDQHQVLAGYSREALQHYKARRDNLASSAKHSDLDPVDEFLAHHGVKGMHWGIRRQRGYATGGPSSLDHVQVQQLRTHAKNSGGIHALSNDDLEAVNKRLNLENNYHRLTAEQSSLDRGRSFVKQLTADTKTVLDVVNTGRQVAKTVHDVHAQASGPRHQSRRTRNAPLKVVKIA